MAYPFDLSVGEWWQVPDVGNSQLADVYATPSAGGSGPQYIMDAWGGGCIDTTRKELLVTGGGHNDYYGNEVYAFCFDPNSGDYLTWRRKRYYSNPTPLNSNTYSDGTPSSIHSYDCLGYHPVSDSMIIFPGGARAGDGGTSTLTFAFDCTTETPDSVSSGSYTELDSAPSFGLGGVAPKPNSAYNPNDGLFYCRHNAGLCRFDASGSTSNQWEVLTDFNNSMEFSNAVISTGTPAKFFWPISGDLRGYRLDTYAYITAESGIGCTGDTNGLYSATGIVYDDNLGLLVVWSGTQTGGTDNRDVYFIDPDTYVVTRAGGTGDTPDDPNNTGTYNRWANLNACGSDFLGLNILVNRTSGHVYFYRSSDNPNLRRAKGGLTGGGLLSGGRVSGGLIGIR